jgi:hypothetical protein
VSEQVVAVVHLSGMGRSTGMASMAETLHLAHWLQRVVVVVATNSTLGKLLVLLLVVMARIIQAHRTRIQRFKFQLPKQ